MQEEQNYTTAQTLGELLDSLDYYASTYDQGNRIKRFSDMQIEAQNLADLHDNLHFVTDRNGEFSVAFEFLNKTIGVFIGKLDENREDMTFILRGMKTLGSAETVETVLHIEKLDSGVLEIYPTKQENPFLVERGLLSVDTIHYLFYKFLSYMVHITRP